MVPHCAKFLELLSYWNDQACSRCCLAWLVAFLCSEEDILPVDRLHQASKMQTRIQRLTNTPMHTPITVPRGMPEELLDVVAALAAFNRDVAGLD